MVSPGNHEIEWVYNATVTTFQYDNYPTSTGSSTSSATARRASNVAEAANFDVPAGKRVLTNPDSNPSPNDDYINPGPPIGWANITTRASTAIKMFTAFETRYKMPAAKPAEYGRITYPPGLDKYTGPLYCGASVTQMEYNYGNSFFSFEVGMAHIIYLNPYSPSNATSPQYQFLLSDLSRVNRKLTPWVIVVMHCPWYNSNRVHYLEWQSIDMRGNLEDIFHTYKVNVVFSGHVHAYERSKPVYNDVVRADGTVYITIGDGGNREGKILSAKYSY
jgi:Calcineurin-like phosphoesterase